MTKPIRFERTGDRQVDQLQRNVIDATRTVLNSPFGDGQWVRGIVFQQNVVKRVGHGLGRAFNGWVAVRKQAARGATAANTPIAIGEVNPQPAGLASQSIDLVASQAGILDFWVF